MTGLLGLLLGALGGLLTAGIGGYVAVRKMKSEVRQIDSLATEAEATAAATTVDAALRLLEPYVAQLATQETAIARLRSRLDLVEAHVFVLEAELRNAGQPVPDRPEPEEVPR